MNVIGRFYFKKTQSGNLIGEYSNNNIDKIISESADLISQNTSNDFIGIYNSTWIESNLPEHCELTIKHKPNSNNNIYQLVWLRISDREILFTGEAMLVDGILIGDYHN